MKTLKSYDERSKARSEALNKACWWIDEKHYIANAFFLDGSMSLEDATNAYKEAQEEIEKARAERREIEARSL